MRTRLHLILLAGLLLTTGPGSADPVKLKLIPRTPEQMSAFYEARGFPAPMIALLAQQCFITVSIHNTGKDIIWHDLSNWRFVAGDRELHREHRDYWKQKWQAMGVPLAKQSTFRWTLLPETLDYQPDEAEGGNIILPRVSGPITLHAEFASGADKRGPLIRVTHKNLRCAEDTP